MNQKNVTKEILLQDIENLLKSPTLELSKKFSKELSELISITTKLSDEDTASLRAIQIAVNACFTEFSEPKDARKNGIEDHEAENSDRQSRFIRNKVSNRLYLVRGIRKRLSRQHDSYVNPFFKMLRAKGNAFYRLTSGVTWFAIIFLIALPLALLTMKLVVETISNQPLKEISFKNDEEAEYYYRWQFIEEDRANRMADLISRVNDDVSLIGSLLENSDATSQIGPLITPSLKENIANFSSELETINADYGSAIDREICSTSWNLSWTYLEESCNVNADIYRTKVYSQSFLEREISSISEIGIIDSTANFLLFYQNFSVDFFGDPPTTRWDKGSTFSEVSSSLGNVNNQDELRPIQRSIWIYLIFAGSFGGCVSVLFRIDEILKNAKENGDSVDLFYTGFYKPIIGLGFAMLAVALIKSNIFGIIRIDLVQEDDPWAYIAIAFVASFSERLAKDITQKLDNLLSEANDDDKDSGEPTTSTSEVAHPQIISDYREDDTTSHQGNFDA